MPPSPNQRSARGCTHCAKGRASAQVTSLSAEERGRPPGLFCVITLGPHLSLQRRGGNPSSDKYTNPATLGNDEILFRGEVLFHLQSHFKRRDHGEKGVYVYSTSGETEVA